MNQRIQELAEQAGLYVDLDGAPWPRAMSAEESEAVYKKFAELIVRDCMDVVDGYTKPRTFDTHYDAVAQIEQLFGIKHNGVEE